MKPETTNPYPVGLLVLVYSIPRQQWYAAQIIGEHALRCVQDYDGSAIYEWCYEIDVFSVPPRADQPWTADHQHVKPITPPDQVLILAPEMQPEVA